MKVPNHCFSFGGLGVFIIQNLNVTNTWIIRGWPLKLSKLCSVIQRLQSGMLWEGDLVCNRVSWQKWCFHGRNVASYSDGPVGSSGGTPFFYLSHLDPTPRDIDRDPRCSFTLSEAPLGSCGSIDTENPTCARLTLTGKVLSISVEFPFWELAMY